MKIGISDNPNPAPNYTYAATFANPLNLDANESNSFYCLVTGNTTINILNSRIGATYIIQLSMDSVGGHTVTLGSMFRAYPIGTSDIDTDADAVNLISVYRAYNGYFIYNVTNVTVESTTTTTTTT